MQLIGRIVYLQVILITKYMNQKLSLVDNTEDTLK